MKHKWITYVLSVSASFCVGFVVGAIADAYSDEIQNTVNKVFKHKKIVEDIPDIDETPEEPEKSDGVKKVIERSYEYFYKPDPQDILKYKTYTNIYSQDEDEFEGKKKKAQAKKRRDEIAKTEEDELYADDDYDEDTSDESDEIDEDISEEEETTEFPPKLYEPFEISDIKYREGEYRKMHLTYFPDDDILANVEGGNGEPIDPMYMIGNDAFNKLLDGEQLVYVENPNIEYDIRVIVDNDREYQEVVNALQK